MQIHLVADKDGIKEWAIIELQGSLRCSDTFDGEMIGNLLWDGSTEVIRRCGDVPGRYLSFMRGRILPRSSVEEVLLALDMHDLFQLLSL
uniref:Chromosome transmission fidelity protein 8 n=1 Tax=Parascaris univalens TaxID=6257 RepID=A0A914ZN98_PARUN